MQNPEENNKFNDRDFKKYKTRAREYIDNKEKAKKLIKKTKDKLNKIEQDGGPFEKVVGDLKLLLGALNDWIRGNYREVPSGSLMMIAGALLYFVAIVDLIPDFILGAGYMDDAAVLAFVVKQIHADLDRYKEWKEFEIRKE
ncbi:MAG: YkvA family protein [Halanaerobiales bacterium]